MSITSHKAMAQSSPVSLISVNNFTADKEHPTGEKITKLEVKFLE